MFQVFQNKWFNELVNPFCRRKSDQNLCTLFSVLIGQKGMYSECYCLLTIGALWLMGIQNITYKIQVNGEGFAYYTEHIV